MSNIAVAALALVLGCYSQPSRPPGADESSDESSSTGKSDTSSTSAPPTSTTTPDDTDASTTGAFECEVGQFDRARFDEACFAP